MLGRAALVWILLSIGSATLLFQSSQETRELEDRLASVNRAVAHEREAIRVLHAEWSYLNSPTRLQRLAEHYLPLEPIEARHFAGIAEIPIRSEILVARASFAPVPSRKPVEAIMIARHDPDAQHAQSQIALASADGIVAVQESTWTGMGVTVADKVPSKPEMPVRIASSAAWQRKEAWRHEKDSRSGRPDDTFDRIVLASAERHLPSTGASIEAMEIRPDGRIHASADGFEDGGADADARTRQLNALLVKIGIRE
jgi:hypothetical protein